MSIKLPFVSWGVTLDELPGEIAVVFELGNCSAGCKGCHSGHLQQTVPVENWADLRILKSYANQEKLRGATAILLMGGTTNKIPYEDLAAAIKELSEILPVGIYSGAPVASHPTQFLKSLNSLKWIKAGEYDEKLGGLDKEGSNQVLLQRNGLTNDKYSTFSWSDVTWKFRCKECGKCK